MEESKRIFVGDFTAKDHLNNKDYFDEEGDLLLEEITGDADFWGWNGNADKLIEIGSHAFFVNWEGNANSLISIGGSAFFQFWNGSADNLIGIGGSAFFYNWESSANKLQTIGVKAYFDNWKGTAPLLSERYIFSELIGSRSDSCKFDKKTKEYLTGCFCGSEKELIKALNKTYFVESRYYIEYMNFIELCKKNK